jgi:hypothetical protein
VAGSATTMVEKHNNTAAAAALTNLITEHPRFYWLRSFPLRETIFSWRTCLMTANSGPTPTVELCIEQVIDIATHRGSEGERLNTI